ncbi:hypothetical protein N7451_007916 [Penicillium sp. IBT 35674x]|nr:hypothetical protein N7451_007916 [Penicillium sp. IBT 35674x]
MSRGLSDADAHQTQMVDTMNEDLDNAPRPRNFCRTSATLHYPTVGLSSHWLDEEKVANMMSCHRDILTSLGTQLHKTSDRDKRCAKRGTSLSVKL